MLPLQRERSMGLKIAEKQDYLDLAHETAAATLPLLRTSFSMCGVLNVQQ